MPYRHYPFMTSRHQPFEVGLFIASVSTGMAFFTSRAPRSMEQFMPTWFLHLWYILLLFGGGIGLITLLLRRKTMRQLGIVLNIERGALLIISSAIFAYICAILAVVKPFNTAFAYVIFIAVWFVCGVIRVVQIQISLKKLREADSTTNKGAD